MSNYTQNTFFATKDNLATGNPSKVIYGSEVDAELDEISTAIASKSEGDIPSGTRMVFVQSSAPTGWTFIAAYNDRVLMGTSTVNQGTSTGGNWTLSLTGSVPLPGHTHGAGNLVGNHDVNYGIDGGELSAGGVTIQISDAVSINGSTATINDNANANVTFGGTLPNTLGAGNWKPPYVKVITCQKD